MALGNGPGVASSRRPSSKSPGSIDGSGGSAPHEHMQPNVEVQEPPSKLHWGPIKRHKLEMRTRTRVRFAPPLLLPACIRSTSLLPRSERNPDASRWWEVPLLHVFVPESNSTAAVSANANSKRKAVGSNEDANTNKRRTNHMGSARAKCVNAAEPARRSATK